MEALVVRGRQEDLIEQASMLSVRNCKTYIRYASDYFQFVKKSGIPMMDPESVRVWAQGKLADHSLASLVPMLAAVKKALRAAAKEYASAREAAAFSEALLTVKAPKKATNAVRRSFILKPAEERAILAHMTARDAALFRFLLATGARISEALSVRLTDCTPDGDMVRVPLLGKGGKAREVRIPASLFAAICTAYGGKGWLFETASGRPLTRDYAYRRIS